MDAKQKYLMSEDYLAAVHPQYQEMVRGSNAAMERAIDNPGLPVKEWAGSYYLFADGVLFHLTRDDQTGGRDRWIGGEQGADEYCDPYRTLRDLVAAVGAGQVQPAQED